MKTVWIVNHYAQVPGGPGGIRHYQLAKALQKHGWNACIIAASTEHNTGSQRLLPGENARLDIVNEIHFLWLRAPVYQGNGLGRIVNMLIFSFRLLSQMPGRLLPRPDAIIGSSVHLFAVWSSNQLAKRFKVPFLFEVRDLWPQTLIDFGLIKNHSLLAKLLRALEGYLYRQSDAIITLLPLAYRYIQRYDIAKSSIYWIPNGVDLAAWPKFYSGKVSDSPLVLMYFGAFGQANSLDTLLMAMHELQRRPSCPAIHLRLIGDGPLKTTLINMANRLGITSISFEDPVPKSDIPRLAAEADVLCANIADCPLYKYGISLNKLYDYMASMRPIVFGCGAAIDPVVSAGAGISVPPANPAALADAICEMARLAPADRLRMGLAGRAYVEREHNSDILGKKLSHVLNSCIEVHRFSC